MDNIKEINSQNYLVALINFIQKRINIPDLDNNIEQVLSGAFFQPFDKLLDSKEISISEQKISQARVAIEVLRRYVGEQSEIPEYLESSYRSLLSGIGTSYDEMRLLAEKDTERLANRLGIKPEHIGKIRLSEKSPDTTPENTLSESRLASLFGLQSTLENAAQHPSESTGIVRWQQDTLKEQWLNQDKQLLQSTSTQIPVLDPDIVSEADINNLGENNPIYSLFKSRKVWLDAQRETIKAILEPQAPQQQKFTQALSHVLDGVNLSGLQEKNLRGIDIEPELSDIALTMGDLRELLKVEQLAERQIVTDREWQALSELLTQVQKVKSKFKKQNGVLTWAEEELLEPGKPILLSPDEFVVGVSAAWDSVVDNQRHWRARRDWEDKLEARDKQQQNLLAAHTQMISNTEESVLPILRDHLINNQQQKLTKAGFPRTDIADWLTQRLFISFKYSGDQRISRLEQGIETLQDFIVSFRTEEAGSIGHLPIGDILPKWQLSTLDGFSSSKFDEEWLWMGNYVQWRSAMFVHFYPENYLMPVLWGRNYDFKKDNEDTIPDSFTDFTKKIQQAGRLSTEKIELILELSKFKDEYADGENFARKFSNKELVENREKIKALLANQAVDKKKIRKFYLYVPVFIAHALQKQGDYLAALDWYKKVYAYDFPFNERKIFYGLESEEEIKADYGFEKNSSGFFNTDLLNVFEIAEKRVNSHTRYVVISIIRCLLDFADAEFTRETQESILLARRLYFKALNLLGFFEVPEPIANWNSFDDGELTQNSHALDLSNAGSVPNGWNSQSALSLQENSRAEILHKPVLSFGQNNEDFTISFALFVRTNVNGKQRLLISKGAGEHSQPKIYLSEDSNSLIFSIKITNDSVLLEGSVETESQIELEKWTHVTCVKQGNSIRVFIDGHLKSTGDLTVNNRGGVSAIDENPLVLGKNPNFGASSSGVNALIDEFYLFNQALSVDAVLELVKLRRVPPNPMITALRQRAEVNIDKLRNGLNIAGMARITQRENLVSNNPNSQPVLSRSIRPTIYRYNVLIERAKQLVSHAQQIESGFLSAIESYDREASARRKAKQALGLAEETVVLQGLRVDESSYGIEISRLQQARSATQFFTYLGRQLSGVNGYERKMLQNYTELRDKRNDLEDLNYHKSMFGGIMNMVQGAATVVAGIAAAPATGGASLIIAGAALSASGGYDTFYDSGNRKNIKQTLNNIEADLQLNTFMGNHQRRMDDWRLQANLAISDMKIANQQKLQAIKHKAIMVKEKGISETRSEHALADYNYLENKFNNKELYEWMSEILSGIYNYFLQQATATAQLA